MRQEIRKSLVVNVVAGPLKRFTTGIVPLMLALPGFAQQVTVDITPGHSTNSFSPLRALGAGIDRDPLNSVHILYDPAHVETMRTAGWGPISYRLNTELSIQAWHWNPNGTWSDSSGRGRGYFVGDANSSGDIDRSFGYNLPHRGTSSNYGTSSGYSMLDDGDTTTYWKSDPYLDETYTGESNSLHPGWIVVDLGSKMGVNAMQIAWGNPYATSYQVQYWTGNDAIGNPGAGNWKKFPHGTVTNGKGGLAKLKLSQKLLNVEFVRVLMTESSNTCDSHGSSDPRNCVGFAIREVFLGFDSSGKFTDLMYHSPDSSQTLTYGSSVDPWHAPKGIAKDDGEQPGFDLVYKSGLTRGLPMTIPVAMLYDNPDNAANEIAYIGSRGYSINYVELGEEPDGQFVLPEDDAALYVQWADAIHRVDPNVKLAGPVFQGVNDDIPMWPDAEGNTSWFTRFLNYLNSHGHAADLNVMTYEHYPFDPCNVTWSDLYKEPQIVAHVFKVWQKDGLPASTAQEITEYNLAFDQSVRYMQTYVALWHSDFVGSFLAAGGKGMYFYQYEPLPMYHGCGGWGTFGMFDVDNTYNIQQDVAEYFSSQMLTQEWAEPVDALHTMYPAWSDIKDDRGNVLVTAYALDRPDGRWGVLLVNKDQHNSHPVYLRFDDAGTGAHHFQGKVIEVSFGSD